ncbi:MAG: trypsin-like peptidase domain-containing protein [Holophaga sp.]|nr:trypsin-like peptidase domain-containing protein [Holophaga sp.]
MNLPRIAFRFLRILAAAWIPVCLCAQSPVENAVVKIFSTLRNPDPVKPWSRQEPLEISGSGVIVQGRRILTNAHMVQYATQVQVQGYGAGDKVPATVEAVAEGIDLALLKLDDESFFDGRRPLPRDPAIPEVKDEVLAYGYPLGGSNLSITKGIISRIEFTGYSFPASGLRIQVDAAINPGNSGGPAMVKGRMAGLVFSHIGMAQGIGYVIPDEEIELFLNAAARGEAYRKPALFDDLPTLENPALRAFLKLDKSVQGVVVHQPYGPGNPLKVWDVITQIGDCPVDDQGMIQLRPNLRVNFRYQVQRLARDGKVRLKLVRAGKPLDVMVPVAFDRPVMVPDLKGAYPAYFVCGPLVFSSASRQLFAMIGRGSNQMAMATSPMVKRLFDAPAFPGEELVVICSPFLPHRIARGYSNPQGNVVVSVNGIAIRNLRHLVTVLRDARDEFVVFRLASPEGEDLVFRRRELLDSTNDLLNENGIRSQGSPELLKLWTSPAAG